MSRSVPVGAVCVLLASVVFAAADEVRAAEWRCAVSVTFHNTSSFAVFPRIAGHDLAVLRPGARTTRTLDLAAGRWPYEIRANPSDRRTAGLARRQVGGAVLVRNTGRSGCALTRTVAITDAQFGADSGRDAGAGVISVTAAIYGSNCPRSTVATQRVGYACDSRDRCTYRVDHRVLGDPAIGCRKSFVVRYRCTGAGPATRQVTVPPEASGRSAVLDCRSG
jgi:hypothetical protein